MNVIRWNLNEEMKFLYQKWETILEYGTENEKKQIPYIIKRIEEIKRISTTKH